jgi:hypothetical protein
VNTSLMFNREEIIALLRELGEDLDGLGVRGEMFIVGGAAMALAYNTRRATRDIDAVFEPKNLIYEAAHRVAARHDLSDGWLNDAVKGMLPGTDPDARECFTSRGISVSVPSPRYLLALKVAAARVDRDADDIRALAQICGYASGSEVLDATVQVMGARANLLPKVQFLIEEMFSAGPEPKSPQRSRLARCGAPTRMGGRCRNARASCPYH